MVYKSFVLKLNFMLAVYTLWCLYPIHVIGMAFSHKIMNHREDLSGLHLAD